MGENRLLLQLELDNLYSKYKNREESSARQFTIPSGQFLCVRLDGYGASKRFLKHTLTNLNYSQALLDAYRSFDIYFKHKFNKKFIGTIVCAFIANDEVSIILDHRTENLENRIMKLCTLLSGVLSSFFSIRYQKSGVQPFDARPILLLSREEVCQYIRSRYLISKRYALAKALKLKDLIKQDEKGVYDPKIYSNIDNAQIEITRNSLQSDVDELISTYRLIYSKEPGKRNVFFHPANDQIMLLSELENSLFNSNKNKKNRWKK